jgi:hypothetical protein
MRSEDLGALATQTARSVLLLARQRHKLAFRPGRVVRASRRFENLWLATEVCRLQRQCLTDSADSKPAGSRVVEDRLLAWVEMDLERQATALERARRRLSSAARRRAEARARERFEVIAANVAAEVGANEISPMKISSPHAAVDEPTPRPVLQPVLKLVPPPAEQEPIAEQELKPALATESRRCTAVTKRGTRCKIRTKGGGLCGFHALAAANPVPTAPQGTSNGQPTSDRNPLLRRGLDRGRIAWTRLRRGLDDRVAGRRNRVRGRQATRLREVMLVAASTLRRKLNGVPQRLPAVGRIDAESLRAAGLCAALAAILALISLPLPLGDENASVGSGVVSDAEAGTAASPGALSSSTVSPGSPGHDRGGDPSNPSRGGGEPGRGGGIKGDQGAPGGAIPDSGNGTGPSNPAATAISDPAPGSTPTDGQPAAPTTDTTAPPSTGGSAPPSTGAAPPSTGGSAPPSTGGSAAPSTGGSAPPSAGGSVTTAVDNLDDAANGLGLPTDLSGAAGDVPSLDGALGGVGP